VEENWLMSRGGGGKGERRVGGGGYIIGGTHSKRRTKNQRLENSGRVWGEREKKIGPKKLWKRGGKG